MKIKVLCAVCEAATVAFTVTVGAEGVITWLAEESRECDCKSPDEYYLTAFRVIQFVEFATGESDYLPDARHYPPDFFPPERIPRSATL